MNERVEKFARECGAWNQVYGNRTFMIDEHFDIEQFSRLIVRECLSIVDDAERGGSNEVWDNAVEFIRRDLKEHFGLQD